MHVVKRSGQRQRVSFDRITDRIAMLCHDLEDVDPIVIAKETINAMYDGIATTELDTLSADICASRSQHAPDYNLLGGRILASNLSKSTVENYREVTTQLSSILSPAFVAFVERHHATIQSFFDYTRDMLFDYFAIKTLERSYLFRVDGVIVERPQHVWMRVAIQIHGLQENVEESVALERIRETYEGMSRLEFTHATPTLFNSGTKRPQLSSCFLYSSEDNIESIFKTVSDTARISKWAGGIGLSLSNIRAKGSIIRGTNGKSEGIVPLCKTLEQTARYINQGGKRSGSIAIYLEPWHADIFSFVELRKNTGDEGLRTRDLFLALWVPDLFMKRVEADEVWSLMCPDQCPGLVDSYGAKFEERYLAYEASGTFRRQVRAREVWDRILENQIETGMPYMAFKDNVNSKNMQSHLGVIRNSNLCCEIQLYSDSGHYAVCNLASICLPRFVDVEKKTFDFERLIATAGVVTRNLNHVIDVNFYPVPETRVANMASRPIGIGVQGLADVYHLLGLPFGSDEARRLNREIFEAIYYGSVKRSVEMARHDGAYPQYEGSPHSKGTLQFDFWERTELRYDWEEVKREMAQFGIRNSMLTALMPTASTSQIMGNTECFEPVTANLYLRKTIAGEFTVVNRNLIRELSRRGLWTREVYEEMVFDNGRNLRKFNDYRFQRFKKI